LMQAEPPGGRMVAVSAGEEQVHAALGPFTATVSMAAITGPRKRVFSGRRQAWRLSSQLAAKECSPKT
jgi:acyl transferase domain-containing protein